MLIRKLTSNGRQTTLTIPKDMMELLGFSRGDRVIVDCDRKEETITIRKMR